MKSHVWPNITLILRQIISSLPKVPQVSVTLFKEQHPNMEGQEHHEISLNNCKVQLKSSYKSNSSTIELNHYLQVSAQERMSKQLILRQQRKAKMMRPTSAKTYMARQDPLDQMSLFHTQNQVYQKNFQSYTALPKLGGANGRPFSAVTIQKSQESIDAFGGFGGQRSYAGSNYRGQQSLNARPQSAYTVRSTARRPFSAKPRAKKQLKKAGIPERPGALVGEFDL